jgi:hypothetical protein
MGDDPMALLGLEGALKHYYYLLRTPDNTPHPPGARGKETCMGSQCVTTGNERN